MGERACPASELETVYSESYDRVLDLLVFIARRTSPLTHFWQIDNARENVETILPTCHCEGGNLNLAFLFLDQRAPAVRGNLMILQRNTTNI